MKFQTLLFFIVLISQSVSGQSREQLKTNVTSATSDKSRIDAIYDLMDHYHSFTINTHLTDSLGNVAIVLAKNTGDKALLIEAYNRYLENNTLIAVMPNAKRNAEEVESLTLESVADDQIWRTLNNIATVYKTAYEFEKAISYARRSLVVAKKIKSKKLSAKSQITIGTCYETNNQKVEALRMYHSALDIAESIADEKLLYICHEELSRFYNFNKLYEQAANYKKKQRNLVLKNSPVDSLNLMWVNYQLEEISYYSNDNTVNKAEIIEVLDFAKRQNNEKLSFAAMSLYRAHLIGDDKRSELYELYINKFPEELIAIRNKNPEMYFRLQALFCEIDSKNDSAHYYFRKAEDLVETNPNLIHQANFYRRYGQFLERQGQKRKAIEKFTIAYDLSSRVSYFEYMTDATRQIEKLYAEGGDYNNAYAALQNYIQARDSMVFFKNEQEIDRRQMQYEFAKHQLSDSLANSLEKNRLELEYQTQLGRQRTQKVVFLAGGLLFIVVAAGLWSRLTLVRRTNQQLEEKNIEIKHEKETSEKLLLNILPKDVAEELKVKGKTEARYYDEAHILFTDFENFTAISEKLNAPELVELIDKHFQKFDEIIGKYQIEKIKTIGDAYMAVGGLPVIGTCNARSVVLAALEMQAFLQSTKDNRTSFFSTFFEMRIGIHSGPVIAGVVGKKKFQYDIWGDSVNIASRIESSGEPGKVNISQATYDLIKDDPDFSFSYRGRVKAKNKGELDMYFVFPK